MHHVYAGGRGDPLCPLGFHPQVRWPTRCKRCFRDYKEHGGKRKVEESSLAKGDATKSTPSLLSCGSSTSCRIRDDGRNENEGPTPSESRPKSGESAFLKDENSSRFNSSFGSNKPLPSSSVWTSTPDLADSHDEVSTTVSLTLPRKRPTSTPSESAFGSSSGDKWKRYSESSDGTIKPKESIVASEKPTPKKSTAEAKTGKPKSSKDEKAINPEVEFILRVKSSKSEATKQKTVAAEAEEKDGGNGNGDDDDDDDSSTTGTETTETTLVGKNDSELQEEVECLRNELELMKARCERVEREKSDILLRRLASLDTTSTKTAATEVLKLQKKVNELAAESEELKDDKKSLSARVRELEKETEELKKSSSASRRAEELQAKLAAAETLCEELMDENEDMKKELRELEEEIEEMQDNFREDQADEYSSLRKELEQATKNCRILSFKLRKSERKAEQLETEKLEAEMKYKEILDRKGSNNVDKVSQLEGDLKIAEELATRLTRELEESNRRLKSIEKNNGKGQTGTVSGNSLKPGGPEKVSRASITRGGSQEDPQQLLRDLQDSLERETDLREQLKFAEEEAANLRKRASRFEEDNDSLALQLKKMATKVKTSRRSSPSTKRPSRHAIEEDEGISDEEDPAELRLLLELNEQESAVLRKKVEELETDSEKQKKKIKELEEKVTTAAAAKKFGNLGSTASLLDREKMKLAEEEVADLKKKLIEREREVERLESEVQLSDGKRTRGQLIKSQSLDSAAEQKVLDTKRQLEVVEQEATVLRTKITNLEAENEKLIAENKKLQILKRTKKSAADKTSENQTKQKMATSDEISQVDRLKQELKSKSDELEKLTKENEKVRETLTKLREGSVEEALERFKKRQPKKPTEFTTKLQLKKMVGELENEIGDILIFLKRSETNGKTSVESNGKTKKAEEFEDETEKEGKKIIEENLRSLEGEREKWKAEKRNLEAEMDKLKIVERSYESVREEIKIVSEKLEIANRELNERDAALKRSNERIEKLEGCEREKNRLESEISKKSKELSDLERKWTEVEEKLKRTEKNLSVSRSKVAKLEKNIEELEGAKKSTEEELREVKGSNSLLSSKIADLEGEIKRSRETIKEMEESIRAEREKATDEIVKVGSIEKKEITALREDLSRKSKEMDELNRKLEKLDSEKKIAEEVMRKKEAEMTREKTVWESKAAKLEADLNAEKKKAEKVKILQEKERKSRETEIAELKSKISSLEKATGSSANKMASMKEEWRIESQRMEKALSDERKRYEDLTTKYEILEEEHVEAKSRLVTEKEQAQNQSAMEKKEIKALEVELKGLRDALASKQASWTTEKKELQEKTRLTAERAVKAAEAKWETAKLKLQAISDERKTTADKLKLENETLAEQMSRAKKENEELRKKLDDFDRITKVQRQLSSDAKQSEAQAREAKEKLEAEERNHRKEMAALRLRYEGRVALISGELQSSQNHLSRFKRERDNYKHMLEEAQSRMAELKLRGSTADVSAESKDAKTTVAALEQQISCMEDELSEARLECSKLRTELVSERSAREVKLSELRSKVNELEEEKILSSGRTKVAGLRTKMELSWQKEREDQQRLLQETSALARDLRQTLYEVERDRDKVKLESKRIQEQIKRSAEEETEENRKKITELQCDLLELRDAHAKLRTTNEKLRREREKWEKEARSWQRSRMKTEEDDRKLHLLLDNVDLLLKTSFEKKSNGRFGDSLAKKRAGSKSRESSPENAANQNEIQLILQRLSETAENIRTRIQINERRSEERSKRASSVGYRSLRGDSIESDTSEPSNVPRRPIPIVGKGSLHRKSLSLSEAIEPKAKDQPIWREDIDRGESLTSLEESASARSKNSRYLENSMDSRLSGGSTQSEFLRGDKKKKTGIFGKLKKLTKSKSIDDTLSSQDDLIGKKGESDSDLSEVGDFKGSKRDLKGKIADMFKKDYSRGSNVKPFKMAEDRKFQTLPSRVSANSSASSPANHENPGRPLDKSKNPAANLLNKP